MIDADDRDAMAETVRSAIADALAVDVDADIDALLARLGWREMLDDEPGEAIAAVFSALGATNATATALDDVVLSALGHESRGGLAVLLPRFSGWELPGRIDASGLRAEGLATARAAAADEILVAAGMGPATWVGIVPRTAAQMRPVRGIDPSAGLYTIRLQSSAAAAARVESDGWEAVVSLGQRAVAHQIAGASRAMLGLARTHALDRVQFGRPIARFQAVRHRLADALVAVEALEAALSAAREVPNAQTAALVKAVAGRTTYTVARSCQQVLAGIGFTMEHPFHRFLKRALALEGLFGSADAIVMGVGRRLLAERRVPTLIEL